MKGLYFFLAIALVSSVSASVDKCPQNHTEEPVFVPNPADCTSYYQCVDGTPILEKCPPGLEWAAEHDTCDWPDVAKCKETETTPSGLTTKEPTDGTTSNESEPPTEVTTGGTIGTASTPTPVTCPEGQGEEDVLIKNPADCHSFFKCYKGKPTLIQCPPGQEWADHLKRCDWPETAKCTVKI